MNNPPRGLGQRERMHRPTAPLLQQYRQQRHDLINRFPLVIAELRVGTEHLFQKRTCLGLGHASFRV